MSPRPLRFASIDEALCEVDRLSAVASIQSDAVWSLPQTLAHCAQSIEYSMTGFPQAKPFWFQKTLGATAFRVFSRRGQMRHGLAETIPGAEIPDAALEMAPALQRLHQAAQAFKAFNGPLQAHFAYGRLDKSAYERAHAMHLANHLAAFDG